MRPPRSLDHSVTVAAPAGLVWSLISDLTRMGEWSPNCAGARMPASGSAGPVPGQRFTGRNRNRWHRWNTRCTVVVAEPEQEIAWTAGFLGFATGYWRYRLEPLDDGNTVVTESWRDLRTAPFLRFPPLVRAVTGATDVVAATDAGMRATLEQLKLAAERHPSERPGSDRRETGSGGSSEPPELSRRWL